MMGRFHSTLSGEIPFTPEEEAEWDAMESAASVPTVEQFDAALTAHLDAVAQARRYDNRITCMVRAGFVGPYQKEAIAFAQWCDSCNASAYQLLTLVQQGKAPMPSSIEAFLESLPVMVWPA